MNERLACRALRFLELQQLTVRIDLKKKIGEREGG